MDTANKNLNDYNNLHTEMSTPTGVDVNQTSQLNASLKKNIPRRRVRPLSQQEKFVRFLNKFFMLLCLAIIVPLATKYPIGHNDGPLNPQLTSGWIVTIILFFVIGLGVKLEYLKRACLFWQMNALCHFIIFVYFPLIGFGIYQISLIFPTGTVSNEMNALLKGIIILCTLPATAASAVVFTANANGNEAAAAINCTMSNVLGIFISPILILIFTGTTTTIDAGDIFFKLSLRVIAPFFVAQIIRISIGSTGRRKLKTFRPIIKKVNEIALLYMIFCALSETFHASIKASLIDIIIFLLLIETLHCHAYFAIYLFSSIFRCCLKNKSKSMFMAFTMPDRIACIYSGVSKTIVLGIPLIETIYGGNENVGMYILPILFYHPSNLIIGSLMVEPLKKLVAKERKGMSSYTYTQSAFTDMTHGTDYGAITPFKIDPHDSFMFAPFAPLPDETEEYESVDDENSTSHKTDVN